MKPFRRTGGSVLYKALAALLLVPVLSSCGPSQGTLKEYLIVFLVETASEDISTLEFDVAYTGGGDFMGEGASVDCAERGNATGASSFTDDDVDNLTVSVSAGDTEISVDDEVAGCIFESTVRPNTANFTINDSDVQAEDASGNTVTATISVEIRDHGNTGASTTTTLTSSILSRAVALRGKS